VTNLPTGSEPAGPAPLEDLPRYGPFSSARPLLAIGAAALVVVIGLMVLSDHQHPATSGYPTLSGAVASGAVLGSAGDDVTFYLPCVRAVPGDVRRAGGFFKVPVAHLEFMLDQRVGSRGRHETSSVSEAAFLGYEHTHHDEVHLYLRAGRRELTNAPGGNVCAGDVR
jgi:hypothetical protein